jgi:hypothetical protein
MPTATLFVFFASILYISALLSSPVVSLIAIIRVIMVLLFCMNGFMLQVLLDEYFRSNDPKLTDILRSYKAKLAYGIEGVSVVILFFFFLPQLGILFSGAGNAMITNMIFPFLVVAVETLAALHVVFQTILTISLIVGLLC